MKICRFPKRGQKLQIWFIIIAVMSHTKASPPLLAVIRNDECPVVLLPHPPEASSTSRVINGKPSSSSLASYIVGVTNSIEEKYCSGGLIGRRLAVSSAFCIRGKFRSDYNDLYVYIGGLNLLEGRRVKVSRYLPDSNYEWRNGTLGGDPYNFAFLELERDAPSANFLKVSINSNLPRSGTWTRFVAYGLTDRLQEFSIDKARLHQVDLPTLAEEECKNSLEKFEPKTIDAENFDNHKQTCAGYANRFCNGCKGDGGGPLIQYDEDENPVLLAIFAAGYGCGDVYNVPPVFTRVAQYKEQFKEYETQGILYKMTATVNEVSTNESPTHSVSSKLPTASDSPPDTPSEGPTSSLSPTVLVAAGVGVVVLILLVLLCFNRKQIIRRIKREKENVDEDHAQQNEDSEGQNGKHSTATDQSENRSDIPEIEAAQAYASTSVSGPGGMQNIDSTSVPSEKV